MVSGLGVDDRCRHWRFRPSHNTRAAPGHKRLVRALLRYLSVSIDSVAGKKKGGHHPVGLDSFCHCLSYYHARPPGLENRRARHVPNRPVTMLERRLLLISVARPNAPAISSSHWQLESPAAPSLAWHLFAPLATVFAASFVIRHSTFVIHCTFCSFPEHHQWNT